VSSFRPLLPTAAILLAIGCTLPGPQAPATPTGTVPASPTPQPSAIASPSAAATPTPTSTPTPTASPTPTPTPTALTTKVTGRVFSDDQVSLAAVAVSARDKTGNLLGETVADGSGVYELKGLPNGIEITLTTNLANYSPRSRPIVLVGETMNVDFNEGWALTNRPEIIAVSPADGATNVAANTPIELTFSTNMDQNSVMSAFVIQQDSTVALSLPVGFTLPGAGWAPTANTSIYDSSNYTFNWVSNSRVTLTPRFPLPTTSSGNVPTYRICMYYNGQNIQTPSNRLAKESAFDADRNVGPFNINRSRAFSRFTVASASSAALKLASGVCSGNTIRLKYNDKMYADLLTGRMAGGADGSAAAAAGAVGTVTAAQAAANYTLEINGAPAVDFNTLAGAKAYFDDSDGESRTVYLEANNPIAASGQVVIVRLKSTVRDVFGRSMSLNGTDNKLTLNSL
jgi:hypothetical protein